MTPTNTGGAYGLNAALRSSLCGPFYTSVCDVHTHLRVHKHPWPCSTLFYPVLLCVLLCVHTHLRVHKHPWPQVSHASRARVRVARNRSVRNRICPSDDEVRRTNKHHRLLHEYYPASSIHLYTCFFLSSLSNNLYTKFLTMRPGLVTLKCFKARNELQVPIQHRLPLRNP
jgi:hypothetical protein